MLLYSNSVALASPCTLKLDWRTLIFLSILGMLIVSHVLERYMFNKILDFCFEEAGAKRFFEKTLSFDRELTERFSNVLRAAAAAEFYAWRTDIRGRLAEIIILDQFSRNIYRDTPAAFAQDPMALTLAQEAIAAGALHELTTVAERKFLLMPYMHSESQLIHQHAEPLFKHFTDEQTYGFEIRHKVIIDQFGRYPHRNAILGRASTQQELDFLGTPNSSF